MNLLITGGLGYIGSQFIRQLPPDWAGNVLLLDNLASQRYPSLFNLPLQPNFRFFEADVCTADLDTYFEGVDVVLHLAALSGAAHTFQMQQELERVNLMGTERVAAACVRQGCKLIFVSTTSIYGAYNDELVDEQCDPDRIQPQTPYADSKLRGENLLREMAEKNNLPLTIFRFGSIFGPSVGIRFDTAVNKFTWQACVGQPLTIWRSALDQQRPYLDLQDAIRAINLVLTSQLFAGHIYNVVTLNTTVRHIIEVISSCVPQAPITLVDSPIMNQFSFAVSSDRFLNQGFTIRGSLEQGVQQTIKLFESLTQALAGLQTEPEQMRNISH